MSLGFTKTDNTYNLTGLNYSQVKAMAELLTVQDNIASQVSGLTMPQKINVLIELNPQLKECSQNVLEQMVIEQELTARAFTELLNVIRAVPGIIDVNNYNGSK